MSILALGWVLGVATEVPEPLKPWVGWVLHDKKQQLCPYLHGHGDERHCAWPASLDLKLDKRSGTFTQRWTIDADAWVALPGNEKHWPLDVKVDGQGALVSDRDNQPVVELKPGVHTVTGRFAWDTLPEALAVPVETGLVSLAVNGKHIRAPEREAGGTLYLQKEDDGSAQEEENRLDVVVHRKIDDDIPLRISTRVEVFVSGKAREVVVGPALPAGFVPMALQSVIPARAEQNGALRMQVRPGRWTVVLDARHPDNPGTLQPAPTSEENWPQEEVWVLQTNPALRVIDIEGVDRIDPSQTTLPPEWKKLVAYRVRAKDVVKLVQKHRGDEEPPQDQLSLNRDIWLDFDGGGYTFRDHMSGEKFRGDRLEMAAPMVLGRVALSGTDQFITRLPSSPGPGVEIGKGSINVTADSRLPKRTRTIPAVGWLQEFSSVKATLHLPPGWKLLTVNGADNVPGTWFRKWSLLELFVVMLTTFGFSRLFGLGAGVLAGFALVLAVPEPDAPTLAWLVVLGLETLVRVVPNERVRGWLRLVRVVSWVGLAFVLIPFLLTQLRHARYPVLEHEWARLGEGTPPPQAAREDFGRVGGLAMKSAAPEEPEAEVEEDADELVDREAGKMRKKDKKQKPKGGAGAAQQAQQSYGSVSRSVAPIKKMSKIAQNLYEHDPKAIVQTGPGLPAWSWGEPLHIGFNGPVSQKQELSFWLLSPVANFFLGFLRVAGLLLLFAVAIGLPGRFWPASIRRWLMPALLVLLPLRLDAAEFPPDDMLEELEQRLLKPAQCAPNCASNGRLALEAVGGTLRLRLELSAAAPTAVPLPAAEKEWLPERVLLDGKPADALLRHDDGTLWLRLPPGAHQVILEGSLSERETVQIPLPLKPHYVEAKTSGWTLDGLHEDGEADDNLQLSRASAAQKKEGRTLEAGVLPPFVRVERTLELGLAWQVETRIVRLTPLGSAVVLEVPLVEGESVTTSDVRVEGGKALVNMGAQEQTRTWRSVLKERASVVLSAKKDVAWVEQWSVTSSPVWHVDVKGIPPVHGAAMTFRPWPGESVTFAITRPEGAQGQSLTIDKSTLVVTPGSRATDSTLTMQVRSSRGGQHQIRLPQNATLLKLTVAGQSQPLRKEGDNVSFAVTPTTQEVVVAWQDAVGGGFVSSSPVVDLGVPSVNATVEMHAGKDSWLLWARGDGVGPAILFYPTLIFLVLVSLMLARLPYAPLRWYHWLLLGLGLTQVDLAAAMIVAGWFLLLGVRRRYIERVTHPLLFNFVQVVVLCWTCGMLAALLQAISNGLLVDPAMQVSGNGSAGNLLRWFSDRSAGVLPRAHIYSVPNFVFRALMLAWSLWLARAFLGWLSWAWTSFSHAGLLRPMDWWRPWRWLRRS